jgi:hypothetical protein
VNILALIAVTVLKYHCPIWLGRNCLKLKKKFVLRGKRPWKKLLPFMLDYLVWKNKIASFRNELASSFKRTLKI